MVKGGEKGNAKHSQLKIKREKEVCWKRKWEEAFDISFQKKKSRGQDMNEIEKMAIKVES